MDNHLNVVEFLYDLTACGEELRLVGDQLQYRPRKGRSQARAQRVKTLRQHKPELIAWLRTRAATQSGYPLSQGQLGMWLDWQRNPESVTYHLLTVARLHEDVQVDILRQAAQMLLDHHPVLRTIYPLVNDQPLQQVQAQQPVAFTLVDGTAWTEAEIDSWIEAEADRPFDLDRGSVMRMSVLITDAQRHPRYLLHWTIHHIAIDHFSQEILQEELITCYRALLQGKQPVLPSADLTYRDFVRWEQDVLQAEEARLAAFWQTQLGDSPQLLNLPMRPGALGTSRAEQVSKTFDFTFFSDFAGQVCHSEGSEESLARKLRTYARANQTTVYTLLLAAYQVLISRYTGQEVFFVNSPTVVRDLSGWTHTVGYLANLILLRADLSGDVSFATLLQRTHQTVTAALAHHLYPYHAMLRHWHKQVTADQFQQGLVGFSFLNPIRQRETDTDLITEILASKQRAMPGPLTLIVFDRGDSLNGRITYHTNRFDTAFIERMVGHLQTLLAGIVSNPNQRLSELPLLTEAERHQLLVSWNDTATDYPSDKCIHHLFEEQVARTPEAVAVLFAPTGHDKEQSLTYRDLNARANQLAHYLIRLGVGPEVLVGICVERSIEMVVGLLGILKAGGAYVPLDPSHPPERHQFIMENANIKLLLTKKKLTSIWSNAIPQLYLDDDWLFEQRYSGTPAVQNRPEHLAYCMYTSGSTGKPKGVLVEHRQVQAFLYGFEAIAQKNKNLIGTALCPFTFDVSVWEMFSVLTFGGTLHILSFDIFADLRLFACYIADHQVTSLYIPPALLSDFVTELERIQDNLSIDRLLVGVEPIQQGLLERFRNLSDDLRIINGYGPTETTVCATFFQFEHAFDVNRRTPIGKAVANYKVYILDANMQSVPVGIPGELYIGGAGVTRGYLNRPQLTEEKFIANPFGPDRLYKTGDLCRYLPDGNIEFLGRIDHQVKVRGFRIELGEIEAVLSQYSAVQEAVVIAREDTPGQKRLVAYVVERKGDSATPEALRDHLRQKLPDYMVPSVFVILDALPLTPNGKIDRRALPAPDYATDDREIVLPSTPTEEILATIWQEVLGIEQVSVTDNFFEVGGDSILSIQIVSRARKAGIVLQPRHIFEAKTIVELARIATKTNESLSNTPVDQGLVTGSAPLLPIQRWFFENHVINPHHFNQSLIEVVEREIQRDLLIQAICHLLQHHDALRLRYTRIESIWQQEHADVSKIPITDDARWVEEAQSCFCEIDLSHLPLHEQQEALIEHNRVLQATLNITTGPLLRVVHFRLRPNQPDKLLFIIHHLAVDLVSWRILIPDFWTIYDQLCQRQSVQLPAKSTSFKKWAEWLQEYAQSEALLAEMDYWLSQSAQFLPSLPVDYPTQHKQATVHSASVVTCTLSVAETQALLQDVPAVYHTQINDLLLTALVQSFTQWTGNPKLLIHLEGHGREALTDSLDLSRTVGWFTTLFPVCLHLESSEPSIAIKSIKEQLRQIPQKGIRYGLLRYLNPDTGPRLAALPQAEISFNYGGQFREVQMDSLGDEWDEREGLGYRFNINGAIVNNQLTFSWLYSQAVYKHETAQQLSQGFLVALQRLIAHCQSPNAGGYTPTDFPDIEITDQTELDTLLATINLALEN